MSLFPIPSMLLKQLYTFGSLQNVPTGIRFALKNRLSDAQLTGLTSIKINGAEIEFDANLCQIIFDLDASRFTP